MKILVTGGGCKEYIDDIRAIVNRSSGTTSSVIAETLSSAGHEVTAMIGVAERLPVGVRLIRFSGFDNLASEMEKELTKSHYDVVIHAAAVSDYKPAGVFRETGRTTEHGGVVKLELMPEGMQKKLDSGKILWLKLEPTDKLIARIKHWAPDSLLIGFKLTSGAGKDEIAISVARIMDSGADLVVHNDIEEIENMGVRAHIWKKGEEPVSVDSNTQLAEQLLDMITDWEIEKQL
ncbi:phosphopantothenoylcysteine decarboxylase [Spirochaetia bacterium 38H-sp]|uniref:Phosphopantothenoylcysteine decarboxylase n=1 Tax=Rarispira pelagica TaxID=3141764 RepID=A0ABU9UA54_9SPIR